MVGHVLATFVTHDEVRVLACCWHCSFLPAAGHLFSPAVGPLFSPLVSWIMVLHELFVGELFACVQHARSRAARGLLD